MKTREQSSTISPKDKKSESVASLFPIAGIGASAGGLDFFWHKKDEVINQDFIQMFVPEPVRKRTENIMIKLMSNTQDKKFKTRVITTGGNLPVEWSVKMIFNIHKKPTGMILIFKR